jgi:hypothetical protein
MFSEFGIIVLILLVILVAIPIILLGILVYMVRALERLGNRALDTFDERLQRLEEQHTTILLKLDRRNNGGRRDEYNHLAAEAGKLIDEYRRLILLSNDPKDKARYEQLIVELKERM